MNANAPSPNPPPEVGGNMAWRGPRTRTRPGPPPAIIQGGAFDRFFPGAVLNLIVPPGYIDPHNWTAISTSTGGLDWINVTSAPYNADPTGASDSTAAIQSAINAALALASTLAVNGISNVLNMTATVFFPMGNYLVSSPLTFGSGVPAVRLTGDWGARIFSNTSGIFDFQNNVMQNLEMDHLTLDATGGHVFANANLRFSYLHHLQLLQRSGGFAIWDQEQAANQMQNTSFTDILWYVCPDPVTNLRSIAAWKIYCPTGASFAEVQFTRVTGFNLPNANGKRDNSQFFYDLACTTQGTSSYITQLAFRDCSFHRCLGGGIKAQSAAGLLIDHMTIQDVFNGAGGTGVNLNANIIQVGTFGTGPPSRAVWVRNYHRGNTAATGSGVDPSDLSVSSDTINVRADGFIMSTIPASDLPQINLNGCAQAVIQSADSGVTVINPGTDTYIMSGGVITLAGTNIVTNQPAPATNGVLAQNFDPMDCAATGVAMIAGTVYALRIDIATTITTGHIWYDVTTAATGVTAGQNFIGLYNSAGTQLASAGIDAALGGGVQKIAITGQTITPGLYYVMIVVNATGMPLLARSATSVPNIGTSGANLRVAVNGTVQTSLPTPAVLSSNTGTNSLAFWTGLAT